MPQPDHVKLVTQGSLPGGEQWTTSVGFGVADGPYGLLDLQDMVEEAMTAWADFQDSFPWLSQGTTIDQVQGYVYGDGVLVEQAASTQAAVSGTASARLPNQCALVISTLTGTPGRQTRGRAYLPALTLGINGNGRLEQSVSQGMANAFGTWLEQVHTGLPLQLRGSLLPAVISQVGQGRRTAITSVRCGNVIDTQRRRREGLVETYSVRNVDFTVA